MGQYQEMYSLAAAMVPLAPPINCLNNLGNTRGGHVNGQTF